MNLRFEPSTKGSGVWDGGGGGGDGRSSEDDVTIGTGERLSEDPEDGGG